MYLTFTLITVTVILLFDWYFFRGFYPLISQRNTTQKRVIVTLYWSLTLYSLIIMGMAVYHYVIQEMPPKFARVYLAGYVLIILLSKAIGSVFLVLDDLKKLVLWLRKKIVQSGQKVEGEKISRGLFLKKTAVAAASLPFIGLSYGVFKSAFDFRVRKLSVQLPNLPEAFEGFRIAQISDIHTGSFISDQPFKEAVRLLMDQKADAICFTGDLVNEIAEEAEPFIDTFKTLNAPYGIYAVLGNHDYGDYFYRKEDVKSKQHNRKKMIEINHQMGWDLLMNEHRIIEKDGAKLGIIGSENWGHAHRFPKYGDLNLATKDMDSCDVNLLLSHDPSHWEAEVLPNFPHIDLTLSGHTHGFQMGIEIPGFKWSPSKYLYKQWAGLYQQNNQFIYVNRGLGFLGYPGRLGILPEITVIELHREAMA